MQERMRSQRVMIVAVAGFLALPVLAWYQYRWIERVAAAERAREESQLNNASNAFTRDFARELTAAEASVGMLSRTARQAPARCVWFYHTSQPQLVKAVFFADVVSPQELRLLELSVKPAPSRAINWAPEWSSLRKKLLVDSNDGLSYAGDWRVFSDVLALVLPMRNEFSNAAVRTDLNTCAFDHGWVIVVLDSSYLYQQVLPRLVGQYFGNDLQGAYHIQIRVRSDHSRVIYDSAPRQSFSVASLKTITLFKSPPNNGALSPQAQGEQLLSGEGPWELSVDTESSPAKDLLDNFRATSMVISTVIFLLLAAALVTLFVAGRRARSLAQAQWEFVTAVTHELRTPLTALRSIAENMCDGVVGSGRVIRYGQLIELQLERLSGMIDDVLLFGRSRSNVSTETSGTVNVTDVVDEAMKAYASTIERHGFGVARNVSPNLPAAQCSAPTLRRAVENLIGNAIKYGTAGRWIGISVRESDGGEIVISIEDRGSGIGAAERKRVFEPFFRGQAAHTGQVPGAGLGLTVAKQCVESLGGRITVDSEPGRWTRFDLFVPVAGRYGHEKTDSHS